MLKNFSVKTLSVFLAMCISSSMLAVPASAVGDYKTASENNLTSKSNEEQTSSQDEFEGDNRADYMSKDQYSQLGFGELKNPDLFDESDTTNPLEDYKPSILSEIYIGQGNYSGGDVCESYIVENAKDYNNLSMSKLKDNKLSYSNQYYKDKKNGGGRWQYQSSITKSIKLGNLSGENYIKDSIIQCSLFVDNADNNKSYLALLVYEYNDKSTAENRLVKKFEYVTKLEDGKFVQDIEVQESGGYMGITVGDFDGDNYDDIAVYFSYKSNPKIGIFKQTNDKSKSLFELKYSIDLKSISPDFDCCKDTNRPLVSLSTTDISGRDDLVVSVTMPYSNDDDFCKDGYTAIYKWENNQPVRKYLDAGIGSGGRMKFTSSATMDLLGDGNKELVIAANKNYNYKNSSSRGDMSKSENLVNIVLWDGNKYINAWKEPQNIEALDWVKRDKDRKEPVTITGTRFFKNSEKDTLFVEGIFYNFNVGTGDTTNEKIKDGKFITNTKFDGSTGKKEAFFHIAESASFVESNRLVEQTLVVMGDGSGDSIYLDVYWCYLNGNSIKIDCTNNDYFDHVDEDDDGTFFTLCPIDIDNDTIYMKYTGKTVGWSNPAVHSVMLSTPYWSELNYGSGPEVRGSTSYSISTSTTSSTTGNWNIGLGGSISLKFGASFLGNGGKFGGSVDFMHQYIGSYQTSNTSNETLTFKSGGGEDYVALIAVPIVSYHYDTWIPEHIATAEDVEEYKRLYGDKGCPNVGDTIKGKFEDMDVNIQLNPVNSCIPVSTYNKVIEEFNRTAEDTAEDNYKLQTIDVDSLYAGRDPGDPSTYASAVENIGSVNLKDKNSYRVSNNKASVDVNGKSSTSISMGEGTSSSISHGYSFSLKVSANQTAEVGIDLIIVKFEGEMTCSEVLSLSGGCTWANSNSENITYTTTVASLPESARTETTSAGTASSAYAFSAIEVKWNPESLGSSSVQAVDGEELTNDTCVIGCLVEGADAAPPKLPIDLHVSSTTSDSITLKWSNTTNYSRAPKSYKLYYSTSSNDNFVVLKDNGKDVIISGDDESYTVDSLKENTTYYFKLKAYSAKDASGNSSVLGPYASGKTKNSNDSKNEPIITKPPVDIYREIGETPIFTIEAEPSNPENTLSYRWQKLVIGDYLAEWQDMDDEFSNSTSFNAAYYAKNGVINEVNAKYLDKTIYRCVVTEYSNSDHDNYTNISKEAVLNIGGEHEHLYDENGFCIYCDGYESAVLNNDGVYEISNGGQLFWFAAFVNGNKKYTDGKTNPNANAVFTQNIDLENREWEIIECFKGTFDGKNYTISNLKITQPSYYTGMFAESSGAIKNFTIKGKIVLSEYAMSVGGVVGYCSGGTVSGINSSVDITNSGCELKHVGGIVGSIQNTQVSVDRCAYYGEINLENSYDCIGGIVGYTNGGARISNCVNHGTVSSSYENAYIGGILGYVNNVYPTVENCYNYGEVSNGNCTLYCGAVIGWTRRIDEKNILNNYYLDTSSKFGFGSAGNQGGSAVSKNISEFASGEVAYLLNNSKTDGTQAWYQNIDNGKTPDSYPMLDNTCGTVYFPDETYYSNYEKGLDVFDKDEDGRFIIRTYDDLVKLAELVNDSYVPYGTASYILESNIIAPKDSEWIKGIGSISDGKGFNGTFDGNGYIIMGLNINNSEYGSLFEKIGEKGIVKDLYVIGSSYKVTSEYAGGIAAVNDGLIDHCISGVALTTGITFDNIGQTINFSNYNSRINGVISGGIAALNNGNIKGCRNASIVKGTEICGGIAGVNNEDGSIYGCASNISIGDSKSKISGGLVGKNSGSIASSYTSAKVFGENIGSIAGENASENVKNVFYSNANGLIAIGNDSTVIPDDTNKSTLKSEMLTEEFVQKLTFVTDDSIEWVCNADSKINNHYPTIKCNFYKNISKILENGIVIKGQMHNALQINCNSFDTNSESYKKLRSYVGNKNIVSSYQLSLTDSNGNYIPSELWYLPGVEISVPVNTSQELSVVGITAEGDIQEYDITSVEDDKLTFVANDIVSFALLSSDASSQPNNNSTNNTINNSSVNTGDSDYSVVYTSLIVVAAMILLVTSLRRKKFE